MQFEPDAFRTQVRGWIAENFPPSLRGKSLGMEDTGYADAALDADLALWIARLSEQGWGAPSWPKIYGGAELPAAGENILQQELARAGAFNPLTILTGMGLTMVGPTLLDFGSEEQKQRHLPGIARGEVRWCLGLSEPNAGSDLASLATRAEDRGDHFALNGQKVWTSGADVSQWCAALVRTDAGAPKRQGLSLVLLPMDQPGVETRPIRLISGASPFCEMFFNDARADKGEVLGELNAGWGVVKRLLEHERRSQTGPLGSARATQPTPLEDLAKRYVGLNDDGTLADSDLRARIAAHLIRARAHALTAARVAGEAKAGQGVSAAVSILKNSATSVGQERLELTLEIMGSQGLGWKGEAYSAEELGAVQDWLFSKATSIYGGSYEIQNNIIAKNVLGLPETTQKD